MKSHYIAFNCCFLHDVCLAKAINNCKGTFNSQNLGNICNIVGLTMAPYKKIGFQYLG